MPPGLAFGPNLPPLKFKEVKTARRKVKSKSAMERARKAQRLERQKERKAWLQMRAKRREEEQQLRAEKGETKVTKAKRKTDPKSHHGTESVDTTILKLLGKSCKSKRVKGKGNKRVVVDKNKVQTEEVTLAAKWKPGMRKEVKEGWQEERRMKQQAKVETRFTKKKATDSTMPQTLDSRGFIADIVAELMTNLPVRGERKVPHWKPDQRGESNSGEAKVKLGTEGGEDDGVVLDNVGSDLEFDRHWDPYTAANRLGISEEEAMPDPKMSLQAECPSVPPAFGETLNSHHPSENPNPPSSFEETLNSPASPAEPVTQSQDSDIGLTASLSEEEQSAESKTKRYLKRRIRRTNTSAGSSDDEDEKLIKQRSRRRKKVFLKRVNPSLTESSGGETPYQADSSDDEDEEPGVERMGGQVIGNMRGGAGE